MGVGNIDLSFIISTKNRLEFLKITLNKLISIIKPNEEIVVVDGDSDDGTKEYLAELQLAGQIHQYISEADRNQAHGWNKAMLLAKGTIIKKIVDDDVFDYTAIRKCANFMLKNPCIDVVISNELNAILSNFKQIGKSSRLTQFIDWKKGNTASFTFSDVHLLIKKSAISYLGLYHTSFVMMDWEYALRISFLKAKIAYYTGYNALSIGHAGSISANKNAKLVYQQGENIRLMYNYIGDGAEISSWSRVKIYIGKILFSRPQNVVKLNSQPGLDAIYSYFYSSIKKSNEQVDAEFIS